MTKKFHLKHELTLGSKRQMSIVHTLVTHCHFRFILKGAVPGTNTALVPEGHVIINIDVKHFCSVVLLNMCSCSSYNDISSCRKHKLNRARKSGYCVYFCLNNTLNKSNLNKSYSRLNGLC